MTLFQAPLDGAGVRRLLDGRLKEPEWQKQVEDALETYGWWWLHVPSNVIVCSRCHAKNYRGIRKGFPDIFAMRPPYALFIELKTERGQLQPEQRRVRDMLLGCGFTYLHARPRDRGVLLDWIARPDQKE